MKRGFISFLPMCFSCFAAMLLLNRKCLEGMPSKKVKTTMVNRSTYRQKLIIALICICLLLLSACQNTTEPPVQSSTHPTPSPSVEASPTPFQSPQQVITPTSTPTRLAYLHHPSTPIVLYWPFT